MWAEARLESIAMGLTEEQRNYYLRSHQELCSLLEKYLYGRAIPQKFILSKAELIPFEKLQNAYMEYKGDLKELCYYILRYKL